MKLSILKILIFSFSIGNSFAQNDVVKNNSTPIDSLDFKYCSAILSDLFENNDQKVSEIVKCRKFFWCTECEGVIGCCQTFKSTYKNYLNNDLLVKINKADLEVKTGLYDEFDGDGKKGKKWNLFTIA
jgi:hypothetical protein